MKPCVCLAVLLCLIPRWVNGGSTALLRTYKPIYFFDASGDSGGGVEIIPIPYIGNSHSSCVTGMGSITEPEILSFNGRRDYDVNALSGTALKIVDHTFDNEGPKSLVIDVDGSDTTASDCTEATWNMRCTVCDDYYHPRDLGI